MQQVTNKRLLKLITQLKIRSNNYSIEIYKGYKSSYEVIFYTDGNTDKKQAIKKALRFLNEKYSISQ